MPSSAPYTIAAAGQTDVGRRRQHNEDAFLCDPDHRLFVVADGMGGHAAGEVASAHAVQAVQEFIASFDSGNEATWPFGIDKGLTPAQNLLVNAIKLANRSVCGLAQEKPEYTGMGTTIVGCRLEEGEAVIGTDVDINRIRGGGDGNGRSGAGHGVGAGQRPAQQGLRAAAMSARAVAPEPLGDPLA